MNVDGGHRAFRGGDDRELRMRSDVARGVHALDACLLCIVNPQKIAFRI
jgi:hypothetical protein